MNTVTVVETDSGTVGEYNRTAYGKAWAIVGMTWEGAGYCAACAYFWPTYEDAWGRGEECPMPVFGSDSFGDPCDSCGEIIG